MIQKRKWQAPRPKWQTLKPKTSKLSLQKCSPKRANTLLKNVLFFLSTTWVLETELKIVKFWSSLCCLNPISGPRKQTFLKHQGLEELEDQNKLNRRHRKAGTKWQCKKPAYITIHIIQLENRKTRCKAKQNTNEQSLNKWENNYSMCHQRMGKRIARQIHLDTSNLENSHLSASKC